MRLPRRALTAVACLVLAAGLRGADPTPDPFRLVPKQADAVLKVESPAQLVATVAGFEPVRQLLKFDAAREQLESTNARRFKQLIDYYEKELGAPWPVLLDRLTGGGVVAALKFERGGKPPFLLVVQSKDEALLRQTFAIVLKVTEQELARQDAKEKPTRESYHGLDVVKLNAETYAALAGSALLVANRADALHLALDLHANGPAESLAGADGPAKAKQALPPDPLAWLWVNLRPAQESAEGKELFKYPKNDPNQVILFGGLIDVIGQAPFVAAGLHRQPDGFLGVVRMPKGRDATPEGLSLHLPPAGQNGSLPLLEPKDLVYSDSFYLDVARVWTEREKLFGKAARKSFDDAEKQVGRFLAGRKLSELLTAVGPYHRIVVAAQTKPGYKVRPQQQFPSFAFVTSMRDRDFGNAMDGILRAVALFTGSQAKLKLVEERIGDVTLVGYRFPENGSLPNDEGNVRFNFSPCFAAVGDQFFAASTIELRRELVALLQKPGMNDSAKGSP